MAAESPKLAINGGTPVRDTAKSPWPKWPVWDEREVDAVRAVFESGTWGSASKSTQVPAFAAEFARFQDAEFGVCNNNGTIALEIGLRALGLGLGDEVIVPPYTFVATATAVILAGGVPVFADIDPNTYNLDPKAAEAAITPRTRGIIAVHIGGCPADMDAFTDLAKRRGLFLMEDCAQAHAAEWRGRKIGAIGDLGTFSFQSSKNLTAGEGGIVLTSKRELYERCWSITNVGRVPQGAFYDHPVLGANFRMTEFQAAILRAQMTRLPEQSARRWENGQLLTRELAKIPGISAAAGDERVTRHAYHLFIMRYDGVHFGGMSRGEFLRALSAEGVPCSAGYVPLYGNALFADKANFPGREVDYSAVHCPVAERVCADEAVWLTQNILLGTKEDMQDIVDAIAKVQAEARRTRARCRGQR